MNNQTNMSGGTTKMKAKDFITLGIFTVLFFAVVMVCIFASAATVVSFAFGCAIAALPGGIIYMLMRAKVPKAWSVLLSGVVIGRWLLALLQEQLSPKFYPELDNIKTFG